MFKVHLFVFTIATLFCSFHSSHSYQNIENVLKNPVFDLENFVYRVNKAEGKQTIESTLLKLKEVEPHFFNNYVLMYKSRSLQTSSFMYPRVLLSSPNATTVITYNGNPKDHGYNKLEVMRFDPKMTKFVFNEISFSQTGLSLSKNNPQKCMNCHQSSSRSKNDPRPNWEPYSIWPGAYSSLSVGDSGLSDPNSRKYDPIVSRDSKLENAMYQKFLDQIVPRHPRYNLLKPMQKNRLGSYFPDLALPKDAPNGFTTDFTDELMNLNVLRIARLITETKIIKDYDKVVYAMGKCNSIHLPKNIFDWHRSASGLKIQKQISIDGFAQAIELIFHPYGISTQDWSMDFGTGGKFAFRNRFGGPADFKRAFTQALEISWPHLKKKNCVELENEIIANTFEKTEVFRSQLDLDLPTDPNAKPALIARCASCHTSTSFRAPHIPFDDEAKLNDALSKNGYLRGTLKEEILYRIGSHAQFFERMPADGYLPTQEEIEDLKKYLNDF